MQKVAGATYKADEGLKGDGRKLEAEYNAARTIVFYLPQYHPTADNNEWWGKGFTEWTNVAKAQSLYNGHYQPRLPTDLGYYDLRVAETRQDQADLAIRYGIEGFCYYHYWFLGRRILERPFNEVLESGKPDFPFCLCWANETWSRRWLGEERNILLAQTYDEADDRAHALWLTRAFQDSRYIRVGARPLFLIYRPMDLPNPLQTTDVIREAALKAGLANPFLVGVDGHRQGVDFRGTGFDTTLNFTPQLSLLRGAFLDRFSVRRVLLNGTQGIVSGDLKIYDYQAAWRRIADARPNYDHIPSVFVGWDNTPRRGRRGVVIRNSSPEKFGKVFREVVASVQTVPAEERFVFINAWNEWAEGTYLEPDARFGHGYLEAVETVLAEFGRV